MRILQSKAECDLARATTSRTLRAHTYAIAAILEPGRAEAFYFYPHELSFVAVAVEAHVL